MPKRYGKAMRQLLETMAEMQLHGFPVEEQGRLSAAQRIALGELVRMRARRKKQLQLGDLDQMMEASTKLGLYDGELEGVSTRSAG